MSFQPITPMGGLPGWAYLNRTQARQRISFDKSPELARDISHFTEKIAAIKTVKDLVDDRQLLKVALGAFGLDDDLGKKFFIQKAIGEGVENPKSMANRMVDKRYAEMAGAFGFGSRSGPNTATPGFAEKIVSRYSVRQFEIAVGKKDQTLRLAMSFKREISAIAAQPGKGDTGWFRILGSPPLRKVVEDALNLPSGFAALKLERQVETLKDKIGTRFGGKDVTVFADKKNVEKFVQSFLIARQISGQAVTQTATSAALTILGAGSGNPNSPNAMEAIFAALY